MVKNTSAEALKKTPRVSDRKRVLMHLFENGPATTSEIAFALGKDAYTSGNTYRPRVKELVRMGLVRFSEETKLNHIGNEERLNELTTNGFEVASSDMFSDIVDELGRQLTAHEKWRAAYLAEHKKYADDYIAEQMETALKGIK